MAQTFQTIINAWSIDFYAGWSIMDLFRVGMVLLVVAGVINYFFDKAGQG